jgi:dihydropteroate synthase
MKGNNIRVIEITNIENSMRELSKIASNGRVAAKSGEEFIVRAVKLKGIDSREANILKCEAYASGMSAYIPDDVMLFNSAKSDILISGTIAQYTTLCYRLKNQMLSLPEIAEKIKEAIVNYDIYGRESEIKGKKFQFNNKSYIMGILNITPDSFSDGGKYFGNSDEALRRAVQMLKDGADIIDIGAESTRPGATPVSKDEEIERVIPIIEKIAKETGAIISIDTYKSETAKEALKAGAAIVNDISGLKSDSKMAEVISDADAAVVIMHMQGLPLNMQQDPQYEDVVEDIISELKESISIAKIAGIKENNIVIDPGLGFGKSISNNLEIINRLKEFKTLGYPLLIGASRKSMIGTVLNLPVDERVEGSLAAAAAAAMNGASIFRVHDVKETKRVIAMIDAIKNCYKE